MESRGYDVLLVEDDPDAAKLLGLYLTAHGVKVRSAADGEEAWRMFLESPPSVVVTDLMLPWVSGAELVGRIRAHPEHGQLPVVVMTASLSSRERARDVTQRLAVQDAFSKPLALKELLECLDGLVERYSTSTLAPLPPARDTSDILSLPASEERDLSAEDDSDEPTAARPNNPAALCALAIHLFEEHSTVVLTVRERAGVRRVLFDDGLIVGSESSVPAESLAGSLLSEGVMDRRMAAKASRVMLETQVSFAQAAQQVLAVDPWVLAAHLERGVRRVVWRALCATDGEHTVTPWAPATALKMAVEMDPVRAVQEAALRVLSPSALAEVLAPLDGGTVLPGHAFEERCAVLRGVASRSTVPLLVQSWRLKGGTVPELQSLKPDQRKQLAALVLSNAVDVGDSQKSGPVRRSAVAEPGGDWAAVEEPTSLAARNTVAMEVLRIHKGDAYKVLELSPGATLDDVTAAAQKHVQRLGPPALDNEHLGPARTALGILRARRAAAQQVLSEPEQRQAYDQELSAQAARTAPALRHSGVPAPAPPPAPPPPTDAQRPSVGPFELLDRMAVGGAAEIFRVTDTRNGKLVVLKRLRPDRELDLPAVTGFIRECELATRMVHPNLLKGLERGSFKGLDYLILEYVDGADLDRVITKAAAGKHAISPSVALFVIRQVLDGLQTAHTLLDAAGTPLGLVHRDLAPRNVLVGNDGAVKLADFGGSVFTLTELAPPEVIGSAGFLSPEQARMDALDARSDLFAVGCILYQLLTGTPAFNLAGSDDAHVLAVHRQGKIQPVPKDMHPELRMLLEVSCAPDREDRFRDAANMRDAVDRTRRTLGLMAGATELQALMRAIT